MRDVETFSDHMLRDSPYDFIHHMKEFPLLYLVQNLVLDWYKNFHPKTKFNQSWVYKYRTAAVQN